MTRLGRPFGKNNRAVRNGLYRGVFYGNNIYGIVFCFGIVGFGYRPFYWRKQRILQFLWGNKWVVFVFFSNFLPQKRIFSGSANQYRWVRFGNRKSVV